MAEPALLVGLPAAGASSRMGGRDKLLEPVEGAPLLRVMAARALATGAPVAVTLPPRAKARHAALEGLAVRVLEVADAAEGMAASLRALAQAARGALMVLPADMPDLRDRDLSLIVRWFHDDPEAIHQATAADGTPGHPVIFPADLVPHLAALSGDEGARRVLRAHAGCLRRVALPGRRALTDLDTPEAWAAWRARSIKNVSD